MVSSGFSALVGSEAPRKGERSLSFRSRLRHRLHLGRPVMLVVGVTRVLAEAGTAEAETAAMALALVLVPPGIQVLAAWSSYDRPPSP